MSVPLHGPLPGYPVDAAHPAEPGEPGADKTSPVMADGLFDYVLPPERIALYPSAERDASRLLIVERYGSRLEHRVFRDLPSLLEPGDLLVLNDTRVFPARLRGRRPAGGEVEVLLTERLDWSSRGGEIWAVLARAAGKIRPGEEWELGAGLTGRVIGRRADERLEVELRGARPVLDIASERGETPLPPYIRRPVDPAVDPQRYQTVYARSAGSCAAPTAGLHFTPELLEALERRGVRTATLTLHVGWATFRPLRPGDPVPPPVPPEPYDLPEETAAAVRETRRRGGRVIGVGTTSARVLEACMIDPDGPRAGAGACALTIAPGHRFRAIDGLLTNFHLPRTTLLMLVAAFGGEPTLRAAYAEALRDEYRFYSYGDAMLLMGDLQIPGKGCSAAIPDGGGENRRAV